MTNILVVYSGQPPNFPATDQNIDAVRYQFGNMWVDAIGGRPTQVELDAFLTPPGMVRINSFLQRADYIDLINRVRTSSPAEIDTWLTNNVTTLAQARAVLGAIIVLIVCNR